MHLSALKKMPKLLLAALAATFALGVAAPAPAHADLPVAHSVDDSGVQTTYYTMDEALTAGYAGATIILDYDVNLRESSLEIEAGKTITIDMNANSIFRDGYGTVIRVGEGANLTLMSSRTRNFTFKVYRGDTDEPDYSETFRAGGVITGGDNNTGSGGGILLDIGGKLTLDNIAVAGNYGAAGGIFSMPNSEIHLQNGTSIFGNKAYEGGGVYLAENVALYMDNAFISDNYSTGYGGGIYTSSDGIRVYMTNGSTISGNTGYSGGGGIFINGSYFAIESSDGTGWVTDNKTLNDTTSYEGGGGIRVTQLNASNQGSITGLTIANNVSYSIGGGVNLGQENTRLINCTITGNSSGKDGGGVYIDNDGCSIEGCTITDNYCGSSYEGGGVFVTYSVDVELSGTCLIRNNTRGKGGSADDLFLSANVGNSARAYFTGGVDSNSKVGVRTGITGSCQIGADITTYTYGTYFCDLDQYYVGDVTDGKLYQSTGAADSGFLAKLNGAGSTRYKQGATVSFDATSTTEGKVFWHWDLIATTGLYPIGDYITDETMYDPTVSYSMPQNDTNLVAVYADRVTKGGVYVKKPVAGEELDTKAVFWRTDGGTGGSTVYNIPITWYELDADDNKTEVTGTVGYGKTYVAELSVDQNATKGLFFSSNIANGDVTVYGDKQLTEFASAAAASVDANGALRVTTQEYRTSKDEVESVEDASVSVVAGTSGAALVDSLPATAKTALKSGRTVDLSVDKADAATLIASLLDADGNVADPGEEKQLTISLPLAVSDEVKSTDSWNVSVTITVLPDTSVATPVLSPTGGAYDRYNGTVKLDDKLQLKVGAVCSTKGAVVKYAVDGGDEHELGSDGEVVLTGEADKSVKRTVKVWAEKTVSGKTVTSDAVTAEYTLDDTFGKTVEISCSDTALYATGDKHWSSTISVTGDLGKSVTITAPAKDGHVFDHWVVDGKTVGDTTLTVDEFSTDLAKTVAAVYTPVVTKIDLGVEAPQADEELAEKASSVKIATGSGKATTDISKYLADGTALAWAPTVGESGAASHGTVYTASLPFAIDDSTDSVKYVLANDVELTINGKSADELGATASVVTDEDGAKTLHVAFASTDSYKYKSLEGPADVKLSFAEACAYADGEESGWGLPGELKVTYACGETGTATIEWGEVTGFEADATKAQELTVAGTVTYPDGMDASGAPATVTATIKVATPKKVAVPTASVAAGTYGEAQSVELACETEGATIRYTTDGSEPTADSPAYDGTPIEVSATTTIKAKAFCDRMAASDTVEFAYTIDAGADPEPEPDPDPSDGSDPGKEDGGETDGGSDKSDTTPSDPEKASGKSAATLVETGDTAWVILPVAALGVIAAAAGAILAKRRTR